MQHRWLRAKTLLVIGFIVLLLPVSIACGNTNTGSPSSSPALPSDTSSPSSPSSSPALPSDTSSPSSPANSNATATASAATATAEAPQGYPSETPVGTPSPTPFSVKSVTMSVNPASIAGQTCGTYTIVTYTATFVVPSNSPGGTVQFEYTTNNGSSNGSDSLTFAAGQTTKTYTFTWSGKLPADHTYPGAGEVMTTSPNQVTSNSAQPSGQCS